MSYMYVFSFIIFLSLYNTMNEPINISPIEQYVIDYVIKLRKEKHLKQEDIATILNVKRTFVTNVESAKNRAKYNLVHIAKLADHFGLSPKDFLPKEVSL
ncbi:helix-turn-helix domain-containing protein [Pedobacter sp. PACM 27299]|uniref:helix-turn-helix domain-containing protein n=1 Tax=Pedobacter sp. PACM 27299 TaxID=1727164 RepID=UPI0018D0D554|nr:helix-turn-helix transcriptional regulator [Pedobacter sp. PACM 27299]